MSYLFLYVLQCPLYSAKVDYELVGLHWTYAPYGVSVVTTAEDA
jgi:hypothetical protein